MPTHPASGRHIGATVVLVVVHALMVLGSGFLLAMFAMGSDACGRQLWCDRPWVGPAFSVGFLAGAGLFIAGLVAAVVLMLKRRSSVWVPLAGCAGQLVLLAIGVVMVLQPAST